MKLLIDTNVILDMIFGRRGCEASMELFKKLGKDGSGAYITASAVTDLFYIIRRETHETEQTYRMMENIFKLVKILSVSANDIQDAFGEKWKDFEDCVQCTVAQNNRMDCIITGNKKDYARASLPVMTPQEYLQS
ncbi:MAG: PIN domain-containing protein [Roseburia sp.]|nr:PIN domain-containing protein [Roseburia sp.]